MGSKIRFLDKGSVRLDGQFYYMDILRFWILPIIIANRIF